MNCTAEVSYYWPLFGSSPADVQARESLTPALENIAEEPISWTRLSQLLGIVTKSAVSDGFFKYYFLERTHNHPYSFQRVMDPIPEPHVSHLASLPQLSSAYGAF